MDSVTDPVWDDFVIPDAKLNDYGLEWPEGTPQIVIEFKCFQLAKEKRKIGRVKSAFHHALNIIQLLWPDELVSIKRNHVLNTYFLDTLYDLCKFEHLAITGPASSGKTYTSAVFILINFYSAPDQTSCLVSTTARQDAERRVWGDIKKLHRGAKFTENMLPEIGEIIEYAGCIVYNPAKIANKDFNVRDFRHGIMVVPTGGDSSGEEALNKIMGTKNQNVIWMVDEGPAMPADIMSPRANLEANPSFMFVMVGNAQYKTDPHGRACEPKEGWSSINPSMKRWRGKTLNVLFLHGEKSPNDLYDSKALLKSELQYPKLSNRFMREAIAEFAGNGDIEYGLNTQHYWRFAIGFWMGSDEQQTVLSEGYIKMHKADAPPEPWGINRVRFFGGFDPGFTAGGDANSVMFISFGFTMKGKPQIVFETDSIEIRPAVTDRKEYASAVADEVVKQARDKRDTDPQDFGGDISSDGGITFDAISKEWGLTGFQLLSSLEASSMAKYANRVTQYWMGLRDLIATGIVRGFNINSKYAKDLFERRYTSEQKMFKVEKKKDMKKRIGRSPDNGDAAAYCGYLVLQSGVADTSYVEQFKDTGAGERVNRYYRSFDRFKEEEADDDINFAETVDF
jgi:hypothetical protein